MATVAPRLEQAAASPWRLHLAALGAAAAAILLVHVGDAVSMVGAWTSSPTFNHCLFLPLILAWLVWLRRPELERLVPVGWLPGLAIVMAGAVAWLGGEAGSVTVARQLGLVLMLQGAVVTILGKAVARGLFFPLALAFFLVPLGLELVPVMQIVTAKLAMFLLALAGVPALLEGIFITTPGGYFRVAEACSGVQFLIAMLCIGLLTANLCFTDLRRRLLFVAVSVLVPILANGVRAAGTILVADTHGIAFAAGFDHIVYGWLFFGLIIAALLAGGWRFFDRDPGDPWFDPATMQPKGAKPTSPQKLVALAALAFALAAIPAVWSGAIARSGTAQLPDVIALPDVPGWTQVRVQGGRPWRPSFHGADRFAQARYRDAAGREVDVAMAVFARQSEGAELVAFGQGGDETNQWSWTGEELMSSHGELRHIVTIYRVGVLMTRSRTAAKVETARVRLLGGPQQASATLVSGHKRGAVDAFLASTGAPH